MSICNNYKATNDLKTTDSGTVFIFLCNKKIIVIWSIDIFSKTKVFWILKILFLIELADRQDYVEPSSKKGTFYHFISRRAQQNLQLIAKLVNALF